MFSKKRKNGYHRIINKKTGKVKLVKHYNNGIIHGKIIYYWDNGRVRLTGQYDKMHRVGLWKTYDYNGELIWEQNYNCKEKKSHQLILLPI